MLDVINFSDINLLSLLDLFWLSSVNVVAMPLLESFAYPDFRTWLLGAVKNVEKCSPFIASMLLRGYGEKHNISPWMY